MNKKKIIIAVGIIVVLVLAGLVWHLVLKGNGAEVEASGTIEATEITISSKVVGRVLEVKVDEGEDVSQAEVLAVIDSGELAAALKSAQAKFVLARDNCNRSKQLYKNKMISSQEYETITSAFNVAAAAQEAARIQYESAVIKAPISGTVLVRAIEVGELAVLGSPIVTLADLTRLNLMVYLAEKDVGKVQLGEEVFVSVDSFPGEKFMGKVTFIAEKAEFTPKAIQTKDERTTLVFGVKIKLPNPDLKLKPGMPADAEFKWNGQ